MSERAIARAIGPVVRALQNLLSRGTVKSVNSSTKMQTLQIGLLSDEVVANAEHFEQYGFTSCPLEGAEHVSGFPGGDRSHPIVLVVADRRYRLQGLASGDAALYDYRGQSVVLTAQGIVVNALNYTVHTGEFTVNATKYTVNAPTKINGALETSEGIKGGGSIETAGDGVFGGKSFLGHTNDGHPID